MRQQHIKVTGLHRLLLHSIFRINFVGQFTIAHQVEMVDAPLLSLHGGVGRVQVECFWALWSDADLGVGIVLAEVDRLPEGRLRARTFILGIIRFQHI